MACYFTGIHLSLQVIAVTFSLFLAVPFAGRWRAPSVLPRILYEKSKILWEAEINTTSLRQERGRKVPGITSLSILSQIWKGGSWYQHISMFPCLVQQAGFQRAPPLQHPVLLSFLRAVLYFSDMGKWPPTHVTLEEMRSEY